MKIHTNCIKMQEESMSKYLEEMVVNSASWISWNSLLKIRAQMGKSFKFFNILNYLLFIENFQIFENFYPLSYSFDIF